MSTISIRVSEKDNTLIRKYAQIHNMDLSTFIRQAVLEKIEDEYDLEIFNRVWEKDKNSEMISHEELMKELDM